MKLLIDPTDDNPRWLGDLRLERRDDYVLLTAQSSRGSDKYEWSVPLKTFLAFAESLK